MYTVARDPGPVQHTDSVFPSLFFHSLPTVYSTPLFPSFDLYKGAFSAVLSCITVRILGDCAVSTTVRVCAIAASVAGFTRLSGTATKYPQCLSIGNSIAIFEDFILM